MLTRLVMPWVLLALCIVVHALMMTSLLRRSGLSIGEARMRFWPVTWLLIRLAGWIVGAHLVEIAIWAFYYRWHQMFPDAETSFYFSAVTYTTVGYGDLVLPERWRIIAGVEGLTGILMCGWSTGLLFALVSRLYSAQLQGKPIGRPGDDVPANLG